MTSTRWDTSSGELLVRCDAQTAHELQVFLSRHELPCKELQALKDSLEHTLRVIP